ncbi:MAG TPA: hypothetical protein V6C81_01170 [Planktothrix sp.]
MTATKLRWLLVVPALILVAYIARGALRSGCDTAQAQSKLPDSVENPPATIHSDQAFAKLKNKSTLKSLVAEGSGITDKGLQNLKDLPQLTDLLIRSDSVSDAGLKNISSLHALKKLFVFCDGKVTDTTLKTAGASKLLEELVVSGADTTDKGLSDIDHLSNLTFLAIENGKLNGSGLSELSKLPKLELLSLIGNEITGASLSKLQPLKLISLTINDNPIGDTGVENIAKMKSLRVTLNLEHTGITKASLPVLAKMPNFTNLSLAHNNLASAQFFLLKRMPQLGRLRLCECALTDDSLKEIGKLDRLAVLDLSNDPLQHDTERHRDQKHPLQFRNKIDEKGLYYLVGMKALRRLNLDYINPSMDCLRKLQRALPSCRFKITTNPQQGEAQPD